MAGEQDLDDPWGTFQQKLVCDSVILWFLLLGMLIPCIVQHQLMLITHFMKHYVEFFPFIRKKKKISGNEMSAWKEYSVIWRLFGKEMGTFDHIKAYLFRKNKTEHFSPSVQEEYQMNRK